MSHEYRKEIAWSDEDGVFIGRCPDLFFGGCHGDSHEEVSTALDALIEETLQDYADRGEEAPLPKKRSARTVSALRARKRCNLTQVQFAKLLNVGLGTLRNWEQGRSVPKGPATRLLALIEENPAIADKLRRMQVRRPTSPMDRAAAPTRARGRRTPAAKATPHR